MSNSARNGKQNSARDGCFRPALLHSYTLFILIWISLCQRKALELSLENAAPSYKQVPKSTAAAPPPRFTLKYTIFLINKSLIWHSVENILWCKFLSIFKTYNSKYLRITNYNLGVDVLPYLVFFIQIYFAEHQNCQDEKKNPYATEFELAVYLEFWLAVNQRFYCDWILTILHSLIIIVSYLIYSTNLIWQQFQVVKYIKGYSIIIDWLID